MIPPYHGYRYRGPGVSPGMWRTTRQAAAEDALSKALAQRRDVGSMDAATKQKLWKSLCAKGWHLERTGPA